MHAKVLLIVCASNNLSLSHTHTPQHTHTHIVLLPWCNHKLSHTQFLPAYLLKSASWNRSSNATMIDVLARSAGRRKYTWGQQCSRRLPVTDDGLKAETCLELQ